MRPAVASLRRGPLPQSQIANRKSQLGFTLIELLTVIAIVGMIGVLAAMLLIPGQQAALRFGVLSALVMVAGYVLRRGFGARPDPL